jgi:hypothetical protein
MLMAATLVMASMKNAMTKIIPFVTRNRQFTQLKYTWLTALRAVE